MTEKVVVITGASSGIGAETVRLLASKGMKLAIGARRTDLLKELADSLPEAQIIYTQVDVTKKEDIQKLVDLAIKEFGHIDVLYNNAGTATPGRIADGNTEAWERMINVNIMGVLNGLAVVLPIMENQKSGHIISTDSVLGRISLPNVGVYAGTKFAIQAIMDSMRKEESEFNIKATMISPGGVSTEIFGNPVVDKDAEVDKLNPEDVANAVAFAIETPANVGINEVLLRAVKQIH